MQKRHCTLRAEWRLLRGQPAQPLSGHYGLGCDYGTPLITIYTNGDPVFLCGSHATAIGRPNDDCIVGVRLLEAQSADNTHPPEDNQRKPTESPAAKNSVSLPTEDSLPAPKIRRDPGPSKKRPVPDLAYGDSSKALVVEAIWNLPAGDLDVFKAELQQGKSLIEAAQSEAVNLPSFTAKSLNTRSRSKRSCLSQRQQSMFPTSSIRHLKKRWLKSSATSN